MKLTAKLTPYSSIVGGGLKLVDSEGRPQFMVMVCGVSNGISKEQNEELSKRLCDGFNSAGTGDAEAVFNDLYDVARRFEVAATTDCPIINIKARAKDCVALRDVLERARVILDRSGE